MASLGAQALKEMGFINVTYMDGGMKGWNEAGLPIGSHFVGSFGDETTLFRLASQLEAAHPWVERKPPVSA